MGTDQSAAFNGYSLISRLIRRGRLALRTAPYAPFRTNPALSVHKRRIQKLPEKVVGGQYSIVVGILALTAEAVHRSILSCAADEIQLEAILA